MGQADGNFVDAALSAQGLFYSAGAERAMKPTNARPDARPVWALGGLLAPKGRRVVDLSCNIHRQSPFMLLWSRKCRPKQQAGRSESSRSRLQNSFRFVACHIAGPTDRCVEIGDARLIWIVQDPRVPISI